MEGLRDGETLRDIVSGANCVVQDKIAQRKFIELSLSMVRSFASRGELSFYVFLLFSRAET